MGTVYNQTGQYEKAIEQFQRALSLDPNDDDIYRALAFAYRISWGALTMQNPPIGKSIAMRPQYAGGYNWLGNFLYGRGRYTEAIDAFRHATELSPDSFRSYYNLGGAYISAGKYDDALAALRDQFQSALTAAALANLGTVDFYLGKFPQAAEAYEKSVELDPQDSSMLGNLAEAYYWIPGKREQAQATYRSAISQAEKQLKINPRDVELISEIGVYHAMLGDNSGSPNWTHARSQYGFQRSLRFAERFSCGRSLWTRSIRNRLPEKAVNAGVEPDTALHSPTFNQLRSNPEFQSALHAAAKPN